MLPQSNRKVTGPVEYCLECWSTLDRIHCDGVESTAIRRSRPSKSSFISPFFALCEVVYFLLPAVIQPIQTLEIAVGCYDRDSSSSTLISVFYRPNGVEGSHVNRVQFSLIPCSCNRVRVLSVMETIHFLSTTYGDFKDVSEMKIADRTPALWSLVRSENPEHRMNILDTWLCRFGSQMLLMCSNAWWMVLFGNFLAVSLLSNLIIPTSVFTPSSEEHALLILNRLRE